jgi:hypothetical protein
MRLEERFFIQKKFLWFWVDIDITKHCFTENLFTNLSSAEHQLANFIEGLKKEIVTNKELKALKKSKNNKIISKYYLSESNGLISGDSLSEVNKKAKMKAFL